MKSLENTVCLLIEGREVVVTERDLKASICRDSFYAFVQEFWSEVVPEDPVWNWHIEFICQELQECAERVFKRLPKKHDLVINVPPGSSKSTICSVMFPVWAWIREASIRSICGSYSHVLALDLSRKSRSVVECDKFKELFPGIELSEDQNTKQHFTTTKGGGRFALGTKGSVTGVHGHFIIIDDPVNPLEATSEKIMKESNRWINETLSMRKIDKEVSVTILIMQRLHQDDPSANYLNKHEREPIDFPIRHIKLPAVITGNGLDQVRPRKLAFKYRKGLLDPVRLSKKALKQSLIALGPYAYAGQILQVPTPAEGGSFKVDLLQIALAPPPKNHFKRLVRYWDKAGTAKKQAAYSVGVLMGQHINGSFWVLDVVRGQWESAKREETIKNTAKVDGYKVPIVVEQEPGSGGKESANATVKNLAGWVCHKDRPTGEKAVRADPFAVQVNSSHVFLVQADWNYEYISELKYFPFSTFKDQVDASSGAFNFLAQTKRKAGGMNSRKKD